MRIVVTGKEGQVVQSLCEIDPGLGVEIVAVGRPELDLAMPATVLPALEALRPDVVVSAAAYTAVDKAEGEPEAAFAINGDGAGAVARAAAALGVPVIHLSTDYVFDGSKAEPYVETDVTGPLSVYGRSKLEGERQGAAATDNHVLLRTCWVYSPFGANFVKTMLRLAESRDVVSVVADQRGRPTSALDIASAVIAVARRLVADPDPALRGTFHLAGSGEASWADFAEAIFDGFEKRGGRHVSVTRIATADYPTPATRPQNSRLATDKLASTFGVVLPDWRQSLDRVLDTLLAKG
ncbi:dTDP-4-dehydrorhamnose reductase [Rhizobiaceae bacterium n13]|uniref:dTDP-4-dehydrorhamnose reductase n=1 Tax=Ferirhizobium litorale TaxID=2927786 RepID=A0AAE3QCL4_9HYPH|nr:dTDP-4-dehydrorhamnose reductase [Fererhizobium litorale]MDI7862068.1 dTDP-4-dehydrorhamnose reductase [Fererhizobium litorale]MDI7922660.1 dTDP-4-dehydrorhamnose reductase [Fererhizobium litorale]